MASIPLRLPRPGLVACRGPAVEPRRDASGGPVAKTGAHIGDDQRVFPQLALGMAAADPRQFGNRRFKQAYRTVIVACRKRPDAATELDRAAARRISARLDCRPSARDEAWSRAAQRN